MTSKTDNDNQKDVVQVEDSITTPIALDKREHWLAPTMIFGGLEFCIPVLMVGSSLIAAFGLLEMIPILIVAFIVIQWPFNAVSGYIGAKVGLPSAVVARSAFGDTQARFIVALFLGFIGLAWWAVQTAVAGNAISTLLGIDYSTNVTAWVIVTIIAGVVFALPSIIGYSSMKWTDYIAVPTGLLLCIIGIYLAIKNIGFNDIINFKPPSDGTVTFTAAVSMVLGLNATQLLLAMDYTRNAKPVIKDNVIIPLGIVAIGMPLVFVGAIMAVGQGTADIVQVMVKLGFPIWGFAVLWLSTWTSQLVNNYSMGLSFARLFKIKGEKGRTIVTILGTVVGIIMALTGILNHFMDFLYLTSLLFPPLAGIIYVDFYGRKRGWANNDGWNIVATIALAVGLVVGYVTTYVVPMGIPVVQQVFITAIVYYIMMKIKAKKSADKFTPTSFIK